MHRYSFSFVLAFLVASLGGQLAIQGQTRTSAQTREADQSVSAKSFEHPASPNSFEQEIEAKNTIAKFKAALSPANAAFGEEVTLSISVGVIKGWHIGATIAEADSIGFPTQIDFQTVGLEPLDADFAPSAEPKKVELAVGTQFFMEGDFSWRRKYRVTAPNGQYSGKGTLRFQACNDTTCLAPEKITFTLGEPLTAESPSQTEEKMPPGNVVSGVNSEKTVGAPIVLQLEPCELSRTRPQIGNIVSLVLFGRSTDKLVWKGTIPAGPTEGVSIYLPKANKYSLTNTGGDGTIVSNTATYVSVDQNGDGVLDTWEAAGVDRPIRIHDTMYRVTDINTKNKTLTLQQLDVPLTGSLIGFRCPDFEYTALDGSVISSKSILGKTTVLDIWAVTCHNCYEGFPSLQRCLDKHSADKLQVILLTVDTDRQFYDSNAPRLFETYGGGDWPQVMIPGGFEGALTIGDYGFGSVVVDEKGIVRAVGRHGHDIEAAIDEVIK